MLNEAVDNMADGINGSKMLAHSRFESTSHAATHPRKAAAASGLAVAPTAPGHRLAIDEVARQAPDFTAAHQDGTAALNGDRLDEASLTAVPAIRHFWDREVATGRVPTGAELSRAAGVPPTTGLGRRERREWAAELPESLSTAVDRPDTSNTRGSQPSLPSQSALV